MQEIVVCFEGLRPRPDLAGEWRIEIDFVDCH